MGRCRENIFTFGNEFKTRSKYIFHAIFFQEIQKKRFYPKSSKDVNFLTTMIDVNFVLMYVAGV